MPFLLALDVCKSKSNEVERMSGSKFPFAGSFQILSRKSDHWELHSVSPANFDPKNTFLASEISSQRWKKELRGREGKIDAKDNAQKKGESNDQYNDTS